MNTFFKAKSTKTTTTTTHFQLNLGVLSYIKQLVVFIELSKTGDEYCQVSSHQPSFFK